MRQIDIEMERQKALLRAEMPEYRYLVNKTKSFIRWALKQVDNPYISCSFGKDSSVLLHLMLSVKKDIPVYCFVCEQTEMLDNYDEVIGFWVDKCNLQLIDFDQSNSLKINKMSKLSKSIDCDSFFNGIRAEESKNRRIALRKYGKFHLMKSSGKYRIAPLAWWETEDIMTYVLNQDLPLLDTYKAIGGAGRTGTFLPNANSLTLNSALQSLKLKSVSDYNKMLKKYPELTEIINL